MIRPVYLLAPGAIVLSAISFWAGAGLHVAPSGGGAVAARDAKIAAPAPAPTFGDLPPVFAAAAPAADVSAALRQRFAPAPGSETAAAPAPEIAAPAQPEPASAPDPEVVVADVPTPPEKPCDMRASGCLDKIGQSFATANLNFEIRQPGYVEALDGPAPSLGVGTGSDAGAGAVEGASSEAGATAQRVAEAALAPSIPRTPLPPGGKVLIYDASQGTDIDPLLQKNWDLNSVQVIPPLKP